MKVLGLKMAPMAQKTAYITYLMILSEKLFMKKLQGCKTIFVECRVALKSIEICTKNNFSLNKFHFFQFKVENCPPMTQKPAILTNFIIFFL